MHFHVLSSETNFFDKQILTLKQKLKKKKFIETLCLQLVSTIKTNRVDCNTRITKTKF